MDDPIVRSSRRLAMYVRGCTLKKIAMGLRNMYTFSSYPKYLNVTRVLGNRKFRTNLVENEQSTEISKDCYNPLRFSSFKAIKIENNFCLKIKLFFNFFSICRILISEFSFAIEWSSGFTTVWISSTDSKFCQWGLPTIF